MKNKIQIGDSMLSLCAVLLIGAGFARPNLWAADVTFPFKNSGMEEGNGSPAAWEKGPPVAGVEQSWDRATAHSGKGSLCLKKTAQR